MEPEQQVCNLGLAKRLKELGLEQDSLWYWVHHAPSTQGFVWGLFQKDEDDHINEHVSAFTIAELGELLPYRFKKNVIAGQQQIYYLYILKCSDDWSCFYAMNNGQTRFCTKDADTEVNARAKMLIWLIEQGITEKDIKCLKQ